MTFQQLAEYFEKLEETSSRLILIDILAELFSKVKPQEVGLVSYLIQGRVAPFYEPIELGMAEKSVASSIAKAYGTDRENVLTMYGQMGDLGKVAQELRDKATEGQRGKLTVKEVFEQLLKIAHFSGNGTVENKTAALSGLLEKMSGIEAKHLVRIPIGASRLGIGDPTILDAFAKLKLGDKRKRKELEGAYSRVSDLGLIGEVLWKDGLAGVQKLNVTFGRPIRSQLCERLLNPEKIMEKLGGKVHIQKKYDGFRVQLHLDRSRPQGGQVRLFSRNLEETTPMFPDLIEGVLKQVKAKSAIFDSEALAFNPESEEFLPFQETTKRRRKYGIAEAAKSLPLKAFVFDIMFLDGKAVIDLPLTKRIELLKKHIEGDGVLIPEPGEFTDKVERIQELFDDAITKGLEGLIVKRPDSPYEAGARNFNWVKQKRHSAGDLNDTVDAVILGYIYGRGKRSAFGAGALLVGVYDAERDEFVTVSKIGTGLTDDEWREVHRRADKLKVDTKPARVKAILAPSVWVKPEIVIEVLADEITRSPIHTAGASTGSAAKDKEPGYALRFPRLVKFRDSDKKAEDATTVKELKEMYELQYERSSSSNKK